MFGKLNHSAQLLFVSFTGSASGVVAPYTAVWDFGDGQTAGGLNTTHTYTTEGTKNVCLSLTDASGCTTQLCKTITVTSTAPPCCDNNDRNNEKFWNYVSGRKFKHVFSQTNFALHRLHSRMVPYKKVAGVWVYSKVSKISVGFVGTVWFEDSDGTNCAKAQAVDPLDSPKEKTTAVDVEYNYSFNGNTFWTRQGSMVSPGYLVHDGKTYSSSLALTQDCD